MTFKIKSSVSGTNPNLSPGPDEKLDTKIAVRLKVFEKSI